MTGLEMIIGTERVPVENYRSYQVSTNRTRMVVTLANPKRNIKIEGEDNVDAAILEIERCLDDSQGWRTLGLE